MVRDSNRQFYYEVRRISIQKTKKGMVRKMRYGYKVLGVKGVY